jgi:DAK2 domain fusion protein YloV
MLKGGYLNLKRNMAVIDQLNVFPVPDGDTGKNMTMTIEGGVAGTKGDFSSIGEMMKSFSRNSLLSARGNSGVILSQFIRGIAVGSENTQSFDYNSFKTAFESGKEYAYNAVAVPTEGTILTLIREGSDFLNSHTFDDFEELFTSLIKELHRSLQHTPELLPVLKEAGVVDSGGAGLVCIFEGMLSIIRGEEIDDTETLESSNEFVLSSGFDENSVLEYGYCTEFILQLLKAKTDIDAFSLTDLTKKLEEMGDSIVTVQDSSLVKVHVHTFSPETVIAYVRQFGELVTVKIENMSVQHSEIKAEEKKKFAVVATATGEGLSSFFTGIGVDVIIDGGRTNNPSAEDFMDAFKKVNAEHIIVLPNDSNVVLTALQASELYEGADIRVIKTKSLAEGYSALSMMDLSVDSVERLIEDMTSCLDSVSSGYVTTSTRDACISGVEIKKGQWMGLEGDTVYASVDDPLTAAMELFRKLPDIEEKQVVTAFYGKGVDEAEVEKLEEAFREEFPLIEIGFIEGNQDVYRYIFAIE